MQRTVRRLIPWVLVAFFALPAPTVRAQGAVSVLREISGALSVLDRTRSGVELLRLVEAQGVQLSSEQARDLADVLSSSEESTAALMLKSDPALRSVVLASIARARPASGARFPCAPGGDALSELDDEIRDAARTASLAYYDEMLDPATGEVRPAYEHAYAYYMSLSQQARSEIETVTRADFEGDNALVPLPRMLTKSEYDFVAHGIEQRARALQKFAEDHYSGRRTYEAVVPAGVMATILQRSGELGFASYVPEELAAKIRFMYGPDILRDRNGVWRIVEDDHTFVGGRGDLVRAREILQHRFPELAERLDPLNDPASFHDQLMERVREIAGPDAEVVVLAHPPYATKENERMHRLMEERGAIVVEVAPWKRNVTRKLVVEDEGVFVEISEGESVIRNKVGYIHIDDETVVYTGGHPEVRHPWAEDGVPGLMDAVLDGRVQMGPSPGIDFMRDKVFGTYVEDLIRFYLNEEPILRNIPSIRFVKAAPDGSLVTDTRALARVRENRARFVLKSADGRGGKEVYIGPKSSPEVWAEALEEVGKNPAGWIAEEFTHLSVVGDHIADIRFIGLVDESGVIVGDTPWGRYVHVGGNGKVNLGQDGAESAVLIVPDP